MLAAEERPGRTVTVKELRAERKKLLSEHFGYSNDNNPFGDRLLAEPFVWKKKNLLLQAAGKKHATTVNALLTTSVSKVQEIKSVKKRREEREAEEALMQAQREELQREKEKEHFQDYFEKEEVFHRLMHIKKTEIRAEQNREQPIDFIVKGLRILNGERFEKVTLLPVPPHEIFDCFNKEPMTTHMIEEMLADVKLHIGVDTTAVDKDYQDFWQALLVLTKDALERAEKKNKVIEALKKDSSADAAAQAAALLANNSSAGDIRDADSGIAVGVASDITAILSGKSPEELDALKEHIKQKLETEEDVDTAYWEAILQKIPLFRARAICLMYHQRIMEKASELDYQLKCERAAAEAEILKARAEEGDVTDDLLATEEEARQQLRKQQIQEQARQMARVVEKEINPGADGSYSPELEPYEDETDIPEPRGPYSPILYPFDEFRSETNILHPDEELEQRLSERRIAKHRERERRLIQLGVDKEKQAEDEEDDDEILDPAAKIVTFEDFVRKEQKNASPDEEVLAASSEMKLKQHYGWEEKYRPRKPRFFNRVRTCYFWNKYNQTHYDHDNPPPKIVQGYKFNIFYPDLIDKTKTPTWTLEPSDTPDTIIVRFHAGPPYEDVAFKVLNREWHLERFRGFRNVFDRGIMQLYFSFKKYCYRR
ncbi:cactin [Cyclospora cayetanensis]|uniref:Splicing factor Cactin n=1 Tax=Cyclospora cayetanensis TaxID=88456 RepID=A0A6P6RW28_9EIME|nr:cactin [Cyclospora cayetanensis]